MQKITPFLWFDNNAEEAMNFYTSVFKNSKIVNITRLKGAPGPNDSMVTGIFNIEGQDFMVLDGGPQFKFNESVSFFVNCEDQKEIDYFWEKLTAHGTPSQCGWLKDKFGLSWQIVPKDLNKYLSNPDPEKAKRAMQAMLQMGKLDISKLEEAVK